VKPNLFCLLLLLAALNLHAQQDSVVLPSDTLQDVTVHTFYSQSRWRETPAAIALLNHEELNRLAPNSMVSVFNTQPGIRMEERSPGSYRFSIRGSLLRSPYGVRNIKIYWNNLPLTDATGNTYLNLVDLQQVTTAEILKGPAASIYGANTGGVVLLNTYSNAGKPQATATLTGGSYGLLHQSLGITLPNKKGNLQIRQVHQQSDGYREQAALRKDVVHITGLQSLRKHQLNWMAFYTSLHYETPGGLTEQQAAADPRQARPATATLPGAVQQQAGVYNETVYAGISDRVTLNPYWVAALAITGSHTRFRNPFITNYEERKENNLALQARLTYQKSWQQVRLQWVNGTEWQYNHSHIDNYDNNSGTKGQVQYMDKASIRQWFVFTQAQLTYKQWSVQAGASINRQGFDFTRLTENTGLQKANTGTVVVPRVAVNYTLNKNIALYASASKGFSPPTLAEIHPADGNFYTNLAPESGWNYEAGVKGLLLKNRLQFDVALYDFRLRNAIVRRNNAAGQEYFVNAGGTKQQGIEMNVLYRLLTKPKGILSRWSVQAAYAYQPYRFTNYSVANTDYSNNQLTGVPRQLLSAGMVMLFAPKLELNLQYNYTGKLPVNDANDAFAKAYHLLQVKIAHPIKIKRLPLTLFAGIDNLLNQDYSLGNDINAAGRRYYNPAAVRNYYGGMRVGLRGSK
jgi:iron complex outermembrane receptor protein